MSENSYYGVLSLDQVKGVFGWRNIGPLREMVRQGVPVFDRLMNPVAVQASQITGADLTAYGVREIDVRALFGRVGYSPSTVACFEQRLETLLSDART